MKLSYTVTQFLEIELTNADVMILDHFSTAEFYSTVQDSTGQYRRVGNKISAIKYIRVAHGLGLKEAKDIVESYQAYKAKKVEWEKAYPNQGSYDSRNANGYADNGATSLGALLRAKMQEAAKDKEVQELQTLRNAVCAILGNKKWDEYGEAHQDYITACLNDGFTIHKTVDKVRTFFAA